MEFIEDAVAWPVMLNLSACLEAALVERGLPGLCRNSPVPGPLAVIDACGQCASGTCGGIGWVRHATEYPSLSFPAPNSEEARCGGPFAYTLELGIARCLPVGRSDGLNGYVPPTVLEQVQATRLQMADKEAMKAAIQCCLDDGDLTYALGGYTAMAAPGDCGGGVWNVTIWSA